MNMQDLAERLAVSVSTIRAWVKTGRLDASAYFKADNTYRFNFDAVLECLHGQSTETSEQLTNFDNIEKQIDTEDDHIVHAKSIRDHTFSVTNESEFLRQQTKRVPPIIQPSSEVEFNNESTKSNILDVYKLHNAIELAQKSVKEGRLRQARTFFQDILERYPNNKTALDEIATLPQDMMGQIKQEEPARELDILRADYKFLCRRLAKDSALLEEQKNLINDFLNSSVHGLDELKEMHDDVYYLSDQFKEINLPNKLSEMTKGLVAELYKIEQFETAEQKEHIAKAWKIAGNLETFFDFLDSLINLDQHKRNLEGSFLETYEDEKDQFLSKLKSLEAPELNGNDLYSLLEGYYPDEVHFTKVRKLRRLMFDF